MVGLDPTITPIIITVESGAITGICSFIEKKIEKSCENSPALNGPSTEHAPETYQNINYCNIKIVLKHIGVIQLIFALIAFPFVTFILGNGSISYFWRIVAGVLLTIVLIIGFMWSGTQVSSALRWQHLLHVAMGIIIITTFFYLQVSSIRMPPNKIGVGFVVICFQTFLALGIGGAMVSRIRRRTLAH